MQYKWLRPPLVSLEKLASLRSLRPLPTDAEFPAWLETAPADFWPWLLQQTTTTSSIPGVNLGLSLWKRAEKQQVKLFYHLTPDEVIEFPWSESAAQIKGLVQFFREQGLTKGATVLSCLPNIPERYWAFIATALCGLTWSELDTSLPPMKRNQCITSPEVAIFLSQEQIGELSLWEAAEQFNLPTTLHLAQQRGLIKERFHPKIYAWNQIMSGAPDSLEWLEQEDDHVLYHGQPSTHLAWMLQWMTEGLCQNIRPKDALAVVSKQPNEQLAGLKAWWWGANL
ncbi:MAG: hypothetical protein AAFU60_17360, partial [Bacteroidota bacterium]